jgi:hypothetical protein
MSDPQILISEGSVLGKGESFAWIAMNKLLGALIASITNAMAKLLITVSNMGNSLLAPFPLAVNTVEQR